MRTRDHGIGQQGLSSQTQSSSGEQPSLGLALRVAPAVQGSRGSFPLLQHRKNRSVSTANVRGSYSGPPGPTTRCRLAMRARAQEPVSTVPEMDQIISDNGKERDMVA